MKSAQSLQGQKGGACDRPGWDGVECLHTKSYAIALRHTSHIAHRLVYAHLQRTIDERIILAAKTFHLQHDTHIALLVAKHHRAAVVHLQGEQ